MENVNVENMGNVNKIFGLEHNPNALINPKMFGMDHTPDNVSMSTIVDFEGGLALTSFKFDKFHREDGPAWNDEETRETYLYGLLHSANAPAVVEWRKSDGDNFLKKKEYYQFDLLHRDGDRPAVTYFSQTGEVRKQIYYQFYERHRDFGPAVVSNTPEGVLEKYYKFGSLHREDGPAYVLKKKNGSIIERFYLFDKEISQDEHQDLINTGIMQDTAEIETLFGIKHGRFVLEYDSAVKIQFYKFGVLHRNGEPAVIEYRYDKITGEIIYHHESFYQYGFKHRTDGPAEFDASRDDSGIVKKIEVYYRFGEVHRNGEPAYSETRKNSNNDIIYEEKYWKQFGVLHRYENDEPAYVKMITRGTKKIIKKKYYKFGVSHRTGGPAQIIEIQEGLRKKIVEVFKYFGKTHRTDGPAILNPDKDIKHLYIAGVRINEANILECLPDIIKYYTLSGEVISDEIKQLIPKNQGGAL